MQGIHKKLLAGLAACALTSAGFKADADPPTPSQTWDKLSEAFSAHFQADRYEDAYIAAKAALLIQVNRPLLCNAGVVAWRLKKWAEAAQYLTSCGALPAEPAKDKMEMSRRLHHAKMLEEARASAGAVYIVAPALANIFVDGFKVGVAPLDGDVFVDADTEHEIKAELFGRTDIQRVKLRGGQRQELKLRLYRPDRSELAKKPKEMPEPSEKAFAAPLRPLRLVLENPRPRTWQSVQPVLARAGLGAAVLAFGGGVILGSEAQKAKARTQNGINEAVLAMLKGEEARAQSKLNEANEANRTRVFSSVGATVLFVGSGVFGAVGLGAIIIDKVWISKDMAGVHGRFK